MSLLGFLHDGPMSGWSLAATAQRKIGEFWSVTQSQVYRELLTLAELGLVEAGELGPRDRRPYAITEAGREAFREWLASDPAHENIRFPLLLTVLFGRHLPPGRLDDFIALHREVHAGRLDKYRSVFDSHRAAPPEERPDPYMTATVTFGIAYEEMMLRWFDDLPHVLAAAEAAPGKPAESVAAVETETAPAG